MEVSYVPPELVDEVWEEVLPMIESGLRHSAGNTTPEHIHWAVKIGEMIMWAVHEGQEIIAITVIEVVQHSARKVLFVVLIAGRDFALWSDKVQSLLKDYKDLIGADAIQATVRDSLTKWLKQMGWRRLNTTMELA